MRKSAKADSVGGALPTPKELPSSTKELCELKMHPTERSLGKSRSSPEPDAALAPLSPQLSRTWAHTLFCADAPARRWKQPHRPFSSKADRALSWNATSPI